MKSLLIMRITVKDADKLKAYQRVAPDIIKAYDGKIIARGGEVQTFEGPEEERRMVVVEFPSAEQAKRFYTSPEYQSAIDLRIEAADFESIAIECVE